MYELNYEIYNLSNPIPMSHFETVYSLLSSSLPQNEMRNKEGQKKLLSDRRYNLLVVSAGVKIIGFIAVWDLEKYSYVEHFAIDTQFRGNGIGGKLLDKCKAYFKSPVILEVEPPESTENATRRIEFYRRHGFNLNDFPYCQPPLQNGFDPLPLKIMSYPKSLDFETFNDIKNSLYTNIYGVF